MAPIQNALLYLLGIIFPMYIGAIMLRVIFQVCRVNFYNPIAQFIVKITNPALVPLRRLIPGFKGYDVAAIVLMIFLQIIYLILKFLLAGAAIKLTPAFWLGIFIFSLGELFATLLSIYTWTVILSVIASWISVMSQAAGGFSDLIHILHLMVEPLLRPIRNKIPSIGVFDISPIVLLILIQLCNILITEPVIKFGIQIMNSL